MTTPKELLQRWMTEKGMDNVSVTVEVGGGTAELGHAYMARDGIYYNARVVLNPVVADMPLMSKGVLWHEFCHLWDYYESGSMGHYNKWIKKWFSKPLYVLAVIVPCLWYVVKLIWFECKYGGE